MIIAGTQPVQLCHIHNKGGQTLISSWETEPVTVAQTDALSAGDGDRPAPRVSRPRSNGQPPKVIPIVPGERKKEPSKQEAPKGFVGWVKGLFK